MKADKAPPPKRIIFTPDRHRRMRIALGLTQERLAKLIGSTRVTILRQEGGILKIGRPRERYLALLALAEHPELR